MSLIKINELEKFYNKGKESEVYALRKISFEVNDGEMIALMGVSGSGKSTLLNILGFMDRFDSGEYLFDGNDVSLLNERALAEYRNTSVGFVMQNYGLILTQTAFENISLPMLFNDKIRHKEIKERCMELLKSVGLSQKANTPVEQLSGGQQQRVAIARAMANNPRLLIADEPTGTLDTQTSNEIMTIFKELNHNNGTTVILATHDEHVAALCGRVLRIEDGQFKDYA